MSARTQSVTAYKPAGNKIGNTPGHLVLFFERLVEVDSAKDIEALLCLEEALDLDELGLDVVGLCTLFGEWF